MYRLFLASVLSLLCSTLVYAQCQGEIWGPDFRYKVEEDVVFDTDSKLTWKRCAEGMVWTGFTCGGVPEIMAWDKANRLYAQPKQGWRLPDKDELASLRTGEVGLSGCWDPAINTRVFPGKGQDAIFWSTSALAAHSPLAWSVNFTSGRVFALTKDNGFHVRLVSVD